MKVMNESFFYFFYEKKNNTYNIIQSLLKLQSDHQYEN